MRLIDEKYRKLKPSIEYLTDEVVIAQAWKKTHAYMRSHNWYADTLALDISALGLESNASSWGGQVAKENFKPYEMELVPAPKSQKWIVDDKKGWIKEQTEEKDGKKYKPASEAFSSLNHKGSNLSNCCNALFSRFC